MKTDPTKTDSVGEYIAGFAKDIQTILKKIRQAIKKAAPDAEEKISYKMPTFTLNGNLVHFAAFKNHIGFYPTPSAIEKFKRQISVYHNAKGSVQFPLNQPIPYDLITKIVQFRVKENLGKAKKRVK